MEQAHLHCKGSSAGFLVEALTYDLGICHQQRARRAHRQYLSSVRQRRSATDARTDERRPRWKRFSAAVGSGCTSLSVCNVVVRTRVLWSNCWSPGSTSLGLKSRKKNGRRFPSQDGTSCDDPGLAGLNRHDHPL